MKFKLRCIAGIVLGLALFVGAPAGALTLNFNDPDGLDAGRVCASSETSCTVVTNDFTIGDFGQATGSITWVGDMASISITVPEFSYTGSYDGVEEIVFSNVTYTVSGWFAPDFGGTGIFSGFGSPVGTVSGTYEQFDGSAVSVSGPTGFSESVAFSALNCTYLTPSAVCGFSVGTLRDLTLEVGAVTPVDHDFIQTFNLAAPEPGTAVLVGLGLFALGARGRRRS